MVSCQKESKPPKAIAPVPTKAQLAWHKLETYAFIHFGLNTYNDLEWGYGNTPAKTFAPDTLDVAQWVRTLKSAGMKGIILTAKHHDGFCLWPTQTTEYSVKNSPWKNGKGDLVKELSDECKKAGLLFGLYLSPWDRHNADYGTAKYVDSVFHQQIKELTTNYGELFEYWFDGANGGSGWYGGADERRSINPNSYYKYEEAVKLLKANNPNVMIFGGTVPTIRWIGNEKGWAGATNYSTYDYAKEKHYSDAQWGMANAQAWIPAEVDVSIRPGWFYHRREDHQLRSLENLVNLYYQSVGRNANLLLNCPIALDGRIPKKDSIRLIEWHKYLEDSFREDLLEGKSVQSEETREGELFATEHLTDQNNETYWASKNHCTTPSLILNFDEAQVINVLSLSEYIALGQRVQSFKLYYKAFSVPPKTPPSKTEAEPQKDKWLPIPTTDTLSTIGYKRLIRFPHIMTEAIKIEITKSKACVCLSNISAFNTPDIVEAPRAYYLNDGRLCIVSTNKQAELAYRPFGGKWTKYTEPINITVEQNPNFEIKARVGTAEATKAIRLPIPAKLFTSPDLTKEELSKLLDGNEQTVVRLPKGKRSIRLIAKQGLSIKQISYVPNQGRDAVGHIEKFDFYVDGKLIDRKVCANIKNNPIPQNLYLKQEIKGQVFELKVRAIADNVEAISLSDLIIN